MTSVPLITDHLPSDNHLPGTEEVQWLSPASFWTPAHAMDSAWHEHAPFASWLIDAARPSTVVELGTHRGFSFFVFAEGVKRLGYDARLFALDSWTGDDQAGHYDENVFESVRAIASEEYRRTTTLIRGFFEDAVTEFDERPIDLLHIDGRHGYDDVKEDFELYLPRLSDEGVVLMHDTNEFQAGFGVHKFWRELSARHPSFEFLHGHGLGVVTPKGVGPDAVRRLIEHGQSETARIRDSYSYLGSRVARGIADTRVRDGAFEDLRGQVFELRRQVESTNEKRRRLENERDEAAADSHRTHQQLAKVYNTASWRMTAPLRALKRSNLRR